MERNEIIISQVRIELTIKNSELERTHRRYVIKESSSKSYLQKCLQKLWFLIKWEIINLEVQRIYKGIGNYYSIQGLGLIKRPKKITFLWFSFTAGVFILILVFFQ